MWNTNDHKCIRNHFDIFTTLRKDQYKYSVKILMLNVFHTSFNKNTKSKLIKPYFIIFSTVFHGFLLFRN